MTNFILSLIICHLINDFIFQTKQCVKSKWKLNIYAHIEHSFYGSLLFFLTSFIFFDLNFLESTTLAFFIFITHLIVDYLKCILSKKIENPSIKLILFILDQIIHLILIINISRFLFEQSFNNNNPIYFKNLVITIAFIFVSFCSSVIIGNILSIIYFPFTNFDTKIKELISLHIEKDNKQEKKVTRQFNLLPIGKTIGILERSILYITLLTLGIKNAGFIITGLLTLKSLTRFKFMEIKVFSEYYLIGTLLSFILALSPIFISNLIPNKLEFIKWIIKIFTFI